MKTEITQLVQYLEKVQKVKDNIPAFLEHCVKDLAQELLARVRKLTPTEENQTIRYYGRGGKIMEKEIVGGELKRGWTAGQDIDEALFINVQKVEKIGNSYCLTIENNVEFSQYVEYGYMQSPHFVPMLGAEDEDGVRTGAMVKAQRVPGQFMLKISSAQVDKMTPAYLENELKKWLTACLSESDRADLLNDYDGPF